MTKHLQRKAHAVTGTTKAWWYEEGKGICLVIQPAVDTQQIVISWAALRGALKRKDQP